MALAVARLLVATDHFFPPPEPLPEPPLPPVLPLPPSALPEPLLPLPLPLELPPPLPAAAMAALAVDARGRVWTVGRESKRVYRLEGSSWHGLPGPPAPLVRQPLPRATSLMVDAGEGGSEVMVGTNDGGLLIWDGSARVVDGGAVGLRSALCTDPSLRGEHPRPFALRSFGSFPSGFRSLRCGQANPWGRTVRRSGRAGIYESAREEAKGLWERAEAIHAKKG